MGWLNIGAMLTSLWAGGGMRQRWPQEKQVCRSVGMAICVTQVAGYAVFKPHSCVSVRKVDWSLACVQDLIPYEFLHEATFDKERRVHPPHLLWFFLTSNFQSIVSFEPKVQFVFAFVVMRALKQDTREHIWTNFRNFTKFQLLELDKNE